MAHAPPRHYHDPVDTPLRQHNPSPDADASLTPEERDRDLESRVALVIDRLRPSIQADGGDVELVGVEDDRSVTIRLHGACVGCPSATITLQSGIEMNLKAHVPEITAVKAVD